METLERLARLGSACCVATWAFRDLDCRSKRQSSQRLHRSIVEAARFRNPTILLRILLRGSIAGLLTCLWDSRRDSGARVIGSFVLLLEVSLVASDSIAHRNHQRILRRVAMIVPVPPINRLLFFEFRNGAASRRSGITVSRSSSVGPSFSGSTWIVSESPSLCNRTK